MRFAVHWSYMVIPSPRVKKWAAPATPGGAALIDVSHTDGGRSRVVLDALALETGP